VAARRFASIEEAVTVAVADLMAITDEDFSWTKPYVDEARAAAERGEILSLDEAVDDIEAHLTSFNC
jgi:hypothetical protein